MIDAYRRDSADSRDLLAIEANPGRSKPARAGRRTKESQRAVHETMGTCAVELGNLNGIEKLLRAFAQRLNLSLIEPDRHSGE